MLQVLADSFAKCEVDAPRMVDEEPQSVAPRFLEGDEVDIGIELGQLVLKVLLGGVVHAWFVGVEA
ncbi:MAG: hypothetical protein E6G51_08545 [Actinobacteria bacterium]|nr:MAG: hypothetical protein E6G51_08545 [Actinomycetota bacterium]